VAAPSYTGPFAALLLPLPASTGPWMICPATHDPYTPSASEETKGAHLFTGKAFKRVSPKIQAPVLYDCDRWHPRLAFSPCL
jgi:hypothetical protein